MQVNLILFSLFLRRVRYFIMGFVWVFLQGLSLGNVPFVPPQIYPMDLRKKAYQTIQTISTLQAPLSVPHKHRLEGRPLTALVQNAHPITIHAFICLSNM